MELSLAVKSALVSRPLLRDVQAVEDTVETIGSALCQHQIRVMDKGRLPLDQPIFCGIIGEDVGIFYLRYGSPVEVMSRWPDDYYLVRTTLAGCGSFQADHTLLETGAGSTVLALPGQQVRSTSSADSERLLVRIHRRLIDQELARRSVTNLRKLLVIRAIFTETSARSWSRAVAHVVEQSQLVPSPVWARMQPTLLTGLVAHLVDLQLKASELGGIEKAALLPSNLRQAIGFIEANLDQPLTLAQLAREFEVAPRTLHTYFRRFLNMTPAAYVRQARLLGLDAALRNPHDARSITQMMLDCGIAHHGRFSSYYERLFGMLPSQVREATKLTDLLD